MAKVFNVTAGNLEGCRAEVSTTSHHKNWAALQFDLPRFQKIGVMSEYLIDTGTVSKKL